HTPLDYGAHARGQIVGLWQGQPYQIAYSVEYNLLGEVARVAWDTGELAQREPGWWVDETGADRSEFELCRTVDIRQTPFTNTLAILYAELGTGMTLEFPVIHIDLVTNALEVAVQRYTALEWSPARARYRFQQGDYEAVIPVDADAIVMNYPGLFRRLYPLRPDGKDTPT
ncbi:MAG TPA: putative glycolipid-binding domain-containing protein, partial [Candidatus Limnocylindrales bacterium]|nr:putative glycolipid-binding domain-containing protein [Candidatus Limnocylindrales bacterium]